MALFDEFMIDKNCFDCYWLLVVIIMCLLMYSGAKSDKGSKCCWIEKQIRVILHLPHKLWVTQWKMYPQWLDTICEFWYKKNWVSMWMNLWVLQSKVRKMIFQFLCFRIRTLNLKKIPWPNWRVRSWCLVVFVKVTIGRQSVHTKTLLDPYR